MLYVLVARYRRDYCFGKIVSLQLARPGRSIHRASICTSAREQQRNGGPSNGACSYLQRS